MYKSTERRLVLYEMLCLLHVAVAIFLSQRFASTLAIRDKRVQKKIKEKKSANRKKLNFACRKYKNVEKSKNF